MDINTNYVDGTEETVNCTEDTMDQLKIGLVDTYKMNYDGTKDRFDIEKDALEAKSMSMETNG